MSAQLCRWSNQGADDLVGRVDWAQNGFENTTDSAISFDDATHKFTIAPASVSFSFFQDGKKYTKSASESVVIDDTEGNAVVYYDNGVLASVANPTDHQVATAILEKALVAYLYWDKTNKKGKLMDERHGLNMAPSTHRLIHFTTGAQWESGLGITISSSDIDQDGSSDSHAQFATELGHIFDEDLPHELSAVSKTTGLEIWYLDGSAWRWTTNSGFSVLRYGSGRLAYNNAGAQAEVSNGDFVLCHIFATNLKDLKPIAIQGQTLYTRKSDARAGAESEINNLIMNGLPVPEFVPIGSVIFQTRNTYGNTVKARMVSTDSGETYVDFRSSGASRGTAATDHGSLGGLGDDDHAQYLLLAGRDAQQATIDPSLDNDLTATGEVLTDATVDANATGIGALLYLASDGHYEEADADAASTMPVTAMALETGTGSKDVLLSGFIRDDSWSWTPGALLYASTTTGAITETAPSGSGDQVQVIGYAYSATVIRFDPSLVLVEI